MGTCQRKAKRSQYDIIPSEFLCFLSLARVPVDPEFVRTLTWDESTPLSYLIPTLTGHGVCTVALVDLLVAVHNNFVEKCRSQLKKKQKKE